MQIDEKTYHLIDQYLAGELSGRALDNFKVKLKDPNFVEQVETQRQIISAIEEVRKQELKELLSSQTKVKYIQNQWGSRWTYLSAAIVILFVSAFFIMKQFDPTGESQIAKEETTTEQQEPVIENLTTTDSVTRVDSSLLAINTPPPAPALEIVEDEVELDEESIADDALDFDERPNGTFSTGDTFNEKDRAVDVTTNKAPVVAKTNEIKVKQENLLSSRNSVVSVMSPDFNLYKEETEADEDGVADTVADTIIRKKVLSTKNLSIEFWSSPIHFKGYQYSSGVLKLYEVSETSAISFKELDNRLYLNLDGTQYFINKNGKDNKFVVVTNSTLLKVLNE